MGFFKIENNIAETLFRINLSEYESRLLWVIMRKTWGWNKEEDHISFSQFETETGISRGNAHPALLRLVRKNIIKILKERRVNTYSINKDTDTWIYGKNKNVISANNMSGNNSMTTNNTSLLQETMFPLSEDIHTKEKENTTKQKTTNSGSAAGVPPSSIRQPTPVQLLVSAYKKLYFQKFGTEASIGKSSWGKFGSLLKYKLEQGYTLVEIIDFLRIFAASKDSKPENLGFDLGIFLSDSIFNKMKALRAQSKSVSKLEDKYGKY